MIWIVTGTGFGLRFVSLCVAQKNAFKIVLQKEFVLITLCSNETSHNAPTQKPKIIDGETWYCSTVEALERNSQIAKTMIW